jgi:hypothetical protein
MEPSGVDVPVWIYACAGLWLIFSVWRGWCLGIVRQAASLLSLAVAVVVAYWTGPVVGWVVPAIGYPAFLRPLAGGLLVGGMTWLLLTIFSAIIFRSTSDQGVGPIRLVYGGMGASLGLITGVSILALGAWGVRWVGSVAEGVRGAAVASKKTSGTPVRASRAVEEDVWVVLKKSLDESTPGKWLKTVDPIPAEKYRLLSKIGRIAASPQALERFLAQPDLQPLLHNANMAALRSDTELREAILACDVWAVLQNPHVQAAARDSQILHVLRSLNVEKALNEALANPPPAGQSPALPPAAPEKKRASPR